MSEIQTQVTALAKRAKEASVVLAATPAERKNRVLRRLAELLRGEGKTGILSANEEDMADGKTQGLSQAMLDRLLLTESRIDGIAKSVEEIASADDPIGSIQNMKRLENGLSVGKMRVPLGLVAMIYESRPNVTVDAGALCLKSGNAVILRGGKEAFRSNRAFAALFEQALTEEGLPAAAVSLIPTVDRAATTVLIKLANIVDLVIPRGGEGLIRFVAEHATVPVIQHFKGVCHVYVDGEADLAMAESIIVNAKVQRPGVCNAAETLLVDRACAKEFVPKAVAKLRENGVQIRGDSEVCALVPDAVTATADDWDTEYLDLVLSVAVVDGIDGAIRHVHRHGSNHTEAIVTKNMAHANRWTREVDASLVLVNASTRFNDGGTLGLGAEIGISTTKLHAYGPMGLAELCTHKWVGLGEGQIRA